MSDRQQKRLEFLIQFTGDIAQFQKAIGKFKTELNSALGLESKLNQKRKVPVATKEAQIFDDPRYIGSKSGLMSKKESDTYALGAESIRAKTSGLRHEVGKLRNVLLLVAFASGGVVASFKEFFMAVVKTEASLNSLNSVAANTGLSFQKLKSYALDLENTGIMSMTGSVSAMKNLAATKISLNETVAVMKSLTDAAAFNRQGTLSWEEAVVGATQGIKNQNSIMVDNAGITKNISIMYKEYALSLGKTAGKLSEAEKRQAIVNGIIQEAGIFAGDAERAMNTYQGRISKFGTEMIKLQRGFGELIAPTVIEMLEKVSEFMSGTKDMSLMTSGIQTLMKYLKEMLDLSLKLASVFERVGNLIRIIFSPISAIFDKLNLEFLGFLFLLQKIGTYMTALGTKMRTNASSNAFAGNQNALLQTAALQNLNFKNMPKNFEQKFAVYSKIGEQLKLEKETEGSIGTFLKTNLNLRLQELGIRSKSSLLAKNEVEILKQQAKLTGLSVATPRFGTAASSNVRLVSPGEKAPKGFQVLPSGIPLASESMRASMGWFEKVKLSFTDLKTQFKLGSLQMKSAFQLVGQSVKDVSINSTKLGVIWNNLKTGALGIGKAFITGFTAALSGLLQLVSVAMTIVVMYQWIKSFFDSNKEKNLNYEKHLSNLRLEKKSREELNYIIEKETNSIKAYNKVLENTQFMNLTSKQGKSMGTLLKDSATQQKDLNLQLSIYENMLKRGIKDEKELEDQLRKVTDARTEGNAILNQEREIMESVNTSFEKTKELLGSMATSNAGNLAPIFESIMDMESKLEENRADIFNRLAQEVDTSQMGVLGKNLKQSNMYYLIKEALETQHQFKIQDIIFQGEKKIAEIQTRIRAQRLKGVHESMLSELVTVQEGYKNQVEALNWQIEEMKKSKLRSKLGIDLFSANYEQGISETKVQFKTANDDIITSLNLMNKFFNKFNLDTKDQTKRIENTLLDMFGSIPNIVSTGYINTWGGLNKLKLKYEREGQEPKEMFGIEFLNNALVEQTNIMLKYKGLISELNSSRDDFSEKGILFRRDKTDELSTLANKLTNVKQNLLNLKNAFSRPDVTEAKGMFEPVLGKSIMDLEDFDIKTRATIQSILSSANANEKLMDSEKRLSSIKNDIQKDQSITNKQISLLETEKAEALKTTTIQLGELKLKYADTEVAGIRYNETVLNTTKYLNKYADNIKDINDLLKNQSLNTKLLDLDIKRSQEIYDKMFLTDPNAAKDYKKLLDLLKQWKIGMEEIKKIDIFTLFEKKIENLNTNFEQTSVSFKAFNDGINSGLQGEGLDSYIKFTEELTNQNQLLLSSLEQKNPRVKELMIAQFNNLTSIFREDSKKFIEDLRSLKVEVNNASKELETTLGTNNLFGNFFERLFDFPAVDLTKAENNFNDIMRELDSTINSKLKERQLLLNQVMDVTQDPSIRESMMTSIYALDDQLATLLDMSTEQLKKYGIEKAHIMLGFFNSLFSGITQAFMNIGQTLFQEMPDLEQDKAKMLKEQDDLFRRGEINELEHGRRVGEIQKYYAQQTSDLWAKTFKSVGAGVLQMMSQVLTAMAAAKAAQEATSIGGTILDGLVSALPFVGIAAALAIGASALSASSTPEAPSFDGGSENDTLSSFGGTIKSENVELTISPTFIIEGQQIFIGSGSVVEFISESVDLMKNAIQQSIENREIDLTSIRKF